MAKRIRGQSPEEQRFEAELLRDELNEADAHDRPALVELAQSLHEDRSARPRDRLLRHVRETYGERVDAYHLRQLADPELSDEELHELENLRATERID